MLAQHIPLSGYTSPPSLWELPRGCIEPISCEALSARGTYPTFCWFLAIAVNVKDIVVKYLTIFIFI
jgi:hypothetical protein